MANIDPDMVPDMWDIALIGPTYTPGIAKISPGAALKIKWDKKPATGTSGATTKLTGEEVNEFTLTVKFWPGVNGQSGFEQRFKWENEILPLLKEAKKGKSAISFYHPAVSDEPMNVQAVVPEEIGVYEQDDAGVWSVSVKLIEFRPPKPATGSPKGAKKKPGDTPLDENEKKIAALTKQLKELANE